MELDPARSEGEATFRLRDGLLGQVEARKGNETAVRTLGERERTVVPCTEARMAVGLVEAEHVGARDSERIHRRDQLVVMADHPVDVVAEVRVRVEEIRACGQLVAQLGLEAGEQLLGALDRLGHLRNLPAAGRSAPVGSRRCRGSDAWQRTRTCFAASTSASRIRRLPTRTVWNSSASAPTSTATSACC